MAKVPTVNPEVSLRVASMPNLPGSVASSMSAPGRAMQGLGRAIGSLGAAFEDQGPSEEDQFNDKLQLLKASNELEFNERKTQAEYNPTEADPATYHEERKGHFEGWAAGVRQRIKDPRKAELFIEQNRGRFYQRTYAFGSDQKTKKSISGVTAAVNSELSKLDPADRETFDKNFDVTMKGVDSIIDAMPGVTSAQKDAMRKNAAIQGLKLIMSKVPAGERLPAIKKYLNEWKENDDGTTERATEVDEDGQPIGVAPGSNDPKMQKASNASPDAGKVPKSTFKIYEGFKSKRIPTSNERRAIFKKGGVVVNLDTNWSKGSQTSPMVVIPDNATPAQRKAAEAYATGIAKLYQEKFGKSLKPRVVTRSQNGRGRSATIHTEPFAVTDKNAVEYFKSGEGLAKHAEILRSTLGTIPGVQFSLPHNEAKGDRGAHGNGTNEVELARNLLVQLSGSSRSSGGAANDNVQNASLNKSRSSVRTFMRKGINAIMPSLIKEHEKAVALLKQRTRVAGMIAGNEPFNSYGEDKKIVDDVFAQGDLHKRMFSGDPSAVLKGVEIAQRLNYVPKPVGDALQGLANHEDPEKRVAAYEAAASILARNPTALDNTDLRKIKEDAENYTALTTGVGKKDSKEAIARMMEIKSPEWKKAAETRKQEAELRAKAITESNVRSAMGNVFERNIPFMNPSIANEDIVLGEYRTAFKEHFTRWGDADMAEKLATNDLKKVYGTTTVRGGSEIMMYPPDRSYPPIGDKGHEYLSDDIVKSVQARMLERARDVALATGQDAKNIEVPEIDMSDIQLIPDSRTAREIAKGDPPSYKVMFMVDGPHGVKIPVVTRWGMGKDDIEAARKSWSEATLSERKAKMASEEKLHKAQEKQRERFKESDAIDEEFNTIIRERRLKNRDDLELAP